jgi:hypothetical protein
MIIHEFEQYSEEWWEARRGRFTASIASKVITPTGKPSTQYKSEIGRILAEQLGYQDNDRDFSSEWMERGSDLEQEARAWFAIETGLDVHEVGFVAHDSQPFGASPDGVIKMPQDFSIIPCEFKVPKPSTHIKWLLDGGLPTEHKAQVHFQMALMDAGHAWFMSYNPELPPLLIKVQRDEYTDTLIECLDNVADELDSARKLILGDTNEV